MKRPLLEVSVEGVDGLIVSQENGADRVELCASVLEGGITPSIGMVRQALRRARFRSSSLFARAAVIFSTPKTSMKACART